MENPILILHAPPIFRFLPTHGNFTRGELKIGYFLERNCLSSLPCVSSQRTCPFLQGFISVFSEINEVINVSNFFFFFFFGILGKIYCKYRDFGKFG